MITQSHNKSLLFIRPAGTNAGMCFEKVPGTKFDYTVCVLENFYPQLFEVYLKATQQFVKDLSTDCPPLPEEIQPIRTVSGLQGEKDFYILHFMIETLVNELFISLKDRKYFESLTIFKNINLIMSHFNNYIRPNEFKMYRKDLNGASGAQSPLRFLTKIFGEVPLTMEDFQTFDANVTSDPTMEDAQKIIQDFRNSILSQNRDVISEQLNEQETSASDFLITLSKQYPDFQVPEINPSTIEEKEDLSNIGQLFIEYLKFKMHHYSIVKEQIPQAKMGTGGTTISMFLISSIFRTYIAANRVLKLLH